MKQEIGVAHNRKAIGDLAFWTLLHYFYDSECDVPNKVFPMDCSIYYKTKAEKLHLNIERAKALTTILT